MTTISTQPWNASVYTGPVVRHAGTGPHDWTNYVVSTAAVLVVAAVLVLASPRCWHWFMFPIVLCGIISGADVVAWLRRRLDTFDPKAIIGLLWFHGTFIAPLLHIALDVHSEYFVYVHDLANWFGLWAALTAPGLILYQFGHRVAFLRTREPRKVWRINSSRFFFALALAVALSAIAAVVLVVQFDALHKEARMFLDDFGALAHVSWILMLGDPLPFLILVGLVHLLSHSPWRHSALAVVVLISGLMVAQFLLLGLRGSRSAVIFVVFLGAVLCHYRLRRVPLTWIMIGVLFLGVGGYYYAFYKRFGTVGFEAIHSDEARDVLARKAGISPLGILLGDLSRAEIQTYLFYRLREHGRDYQLRMGRTYLSAGMMVVPRAVWPTKPSDRMSKAAAGTDLQYGEGTFSADKRKSSAVYGPAGEALLNFGAVGIPLSYLVMGVVTGWYRRKLLGLDPRDDRFYLVPLFTLALCVAAFGDFDNVIFGFLKNATLLTAVILFSCSRFRRGLTASFSYVHPQ